MAPLDTGIVALVLPNIARDFQTGIGIAIWVPVIYLMILTAFIVRDSYDYYYHSYDSYLL